MKLDGLKVLDLSLFLPGPMLTLALAQHGAHVIKIEPPGEGDPTRRIGLSEDGLSVYFRNVNRGKDSIQLDLKSEDGLATFWRLARDADVLVEAFRPGVMSRLGIDYTAARTANPRIIYCSISAFGQTGPNRNRPAHDLAVEALAGVATLNGGLDGAPVLPHMPVADALASLYGLSGVLMALLRREKTGLGDYVDISMYESLLTWTANISHTVFARGEPPEPSTERTLGGYALYSLYETADRAWIALGGSEAKFARELLAALGREDLLPVALSPPGPSQQTLKDFLVATFKTRSKSEWVKWFEGRDICFAPVRNLAEALQDEALTESGFRRIDLAGHPYLDSPIHFLGEPGERSGLPAPALAEQQASGTQAGWRR